MARRAGSGVKRKLAQAGFFAYPFGSEISSKSSRLIKTKSNLLVTGRKR